MTALNMNERAWALADRAVVRADELKIASHALACGARVIDAGISVGGGMAAGPLLAALGRGGLGSIAYVPIVIGGEPWAGVQVWTDHPAESCMASQYAGWAINPDGYFAMGSGPLRAKARVEKELYEQLDYAEDVARGVLVLETRTLPDDDVATWVANRAGVAP